MPAAVMRIASSVAGTLVFVIGLAAVILLRTPIAFAPAGAGVPATPEQLKATGADALEAALEPGGAGLTFEVVQVSTLHAKPDGPRIQIHAPDDQTKIIEETDQYEIGTVLSRGSVTPGAFWMDILIAPTSSPDFEAAYLFARVLERDGKLSRDDGNGWYSIDDSPGIGMDPVTARLLPVMLRSLADGSQLGAAQFDGRTLAGVRGKSGPDAFPGVIAADGAEFTEKAFAVDCWFDDQGRLVRLEALVRNLNQTTYDLTIETTITFTYGATGEPPDPNPTMAPEALSTSEPEAAEVAK